MRNLANNTTREVKMEEVKTRYFRAQYEEISVNESVFVTSNNCFVNHREMLTATKRPDIMSWGCGYMVCNHFWVDEITGQKRMRRQCPRSKLTSPLQIDVLLNAHIGVQKNFDMHSVCGMKK